MLSIRSNGGLKKLTIPTPYAVGDVHLYLYEGRDGILLFDVGPPTEECFSYLAKNIDLKKVKHIFITHSHADHCGALGFVAKHSNAEIFVPEKDILKNRLHNKIVNKLKEILLSLGFPESLLPSMEKVLEKFKEESPIPEKSKAVEKSILPQGIEFIECSGHSLTDFVYITEKQYAITGDFLLNGIFQTPLIEIDPVSMEPFNNYKAYCKSILNLEKLRNFLILPSHGEIKKAEDAVVFYVKKITGRSRFVQQCLKEGCTIFDMVSRLTDPFSNPFKAFLKASELLFFKEFVENPLLLYNSLQQVGLLPILEKDLEYFL